MFFPSFRLSLTTRVFCKCVTSRRSHNVVIFGQLSHLHSQPGEDRRDTHVLLTVSLGDFSLLTSLCPPDGADGLRVFCHSSVVVKDVGFPKLGSLSSLEHTTYLSQMAKVCLECLLALHHWGDPLVFTWSCVTGNNHECDFCC